MNICFMHRSQTVNILNVMVNRWLIVWAITGGPPTVGVRGDFGVATFASKTRQCNHHQSKVIKRSQSVLLGISSLESSVMLHGSVANRWRPFEGVDEDGTAAADEIPGKLLFEGGTGELLPVPAKCSMLRPSQ